MEKKKETTQPLIAHGSKQPEIRTGLTICFEFNKIINYHKISLFLLVK